jgi:hypothetical protein
VNGCHLRWLAVTVSLRQICKTRLKAPFRCFLLFCLADFALRMVREFLVMPTVGLTKCVADRNADHCDNVIFCSPLYAEPHA